MIRYSPEHVAWLRAEPAKAEAESEAALVLAADDYGYDRLGNTWDELDPTHLGGPVTTTAAMQRPPKVP